MSDSLKEVVKLAQAGVPEEVILAYVTNSAQPFYLASDALVYLNDLGVSPGVQTALIYHDNLPAIAEKKSIGQSGSLPPHLVLNTPATTATPPLRQQHPADSPAPPVPTDASTIAAQPPEQDVTVPYFYNSLAPYGNWVEVEGVGLCWQPTVAVVNSSWRPYGDRGRWLWSDAGWYWYSDYSWGWAPFHYGRWASYPRVGWVWSPDTVWGPSWVSWRYTHDYCGWAPLPPRSYAVTGVGLWFGGSAVSVGFDFGLAAHCYTFLPLHRFCDPAPHHYFVGGLHATTIYQNSTVINNYVVGNNNTIINHGIGRERVAQATRSEIPRARLVDAAAPVGRTARAERIQGSGASMVITRPRIAVETPVTSVPPRHEVTRNQGLTAFSTASKPSIADPSGVRTGPGLPVRPQLTGNSISGHNETPIHTAPSITAPGRPSAFAPVSAAQGSPSSSAIQRPGPSTTVANRNEAPASREKVQPGSIIINRQNAGATKYNNNSAPSPARADSAPSVARAQSPSAITQPARPSTFSPSTSVAPPMRAQPAPGYHAEPARPSAPPAVSGPAASVPSPAHSQGGGANRSEAGASRSESRSNSGGGGRGRNER
jgi:hypothetical protein